MSELDLIIQSIKAAKAANLAALHALDVVERLLGAEGEPISKTDRPTSHLVKKVSDAIPDGTCQHAEAVKVETTEGAFMVCDCGVQQTI